MRTVQLTALVTLSLALSACGGGEGGSVVSTPAPITTTTPTAPSSFALTATPAITTGDYKAIGDGANAAISTIQSVQHSGTASITQPDTLVDIVSPQLAPVGGVTLKIDAATRTYTLTVNAGAYPFPSESVTLPAGSPLGNTRNNPVFDGAPADWIARGDMMTSHVRVSDTKEGYPRVVSIFLEIYNVGQADGGPRYLSAAQWTQLYQVNSSGTNSAADLKVTESSNGIMVFGRRSFLYDLPASGTAHFDLQPVSIHGHPIPDGTVGLDLDFGKLMVAANYSSTVHVDSYETDQDGNQVIGLDGKPHLLGSETRTVLASGQSKLGSATDFSIPLAGTGLVQSQQTGQPAIPDISRPVSGSIDGAFFGPQAEEVGGIWSLPAIASDGTVSKTLGAFFGQRAKP